MNTKLLITGFIIAIISFSARAQVQTIVMGLGNTNSATITVPANSFAALKTINSQYGAWLAVNMQGINFTFDPSFEILNGYTIAGPATIQLINGGGGPAGGPAFATFAIEPGPFPPGKTLTVGANSGNVQVTMQMSTNLVNWTPAVNGMVYTNTPAARFFRIQSVANAQGP
jgi:hypothetical protein